MQTSPVSNMHGSHLYEISHRITSLTKQRERTLRLVRLGNVRLPANPHALSVPHIGRPRGLTTSAGVITAVVCFSLCIVKNCSSSHGYVTDGHKGGNRQRGQRDNSCYKTSLEADDSHFVRCCRLQSRCIHTFHSHITSLSTCSFCQMNEATQITMPYTIAVYMVQDFLGPAASQYQISRLTGILVSRLPSFTQVCHAGPM